MRMFSRLGILAVCLLLPTLAAAGDSGWYLGLGLGQSRASAPPPLFTQNTEFQDMDVVDYSSDAANQRATASRVEAGYWFDSYFGLQAGYVDLGQYTRLSRGTFTFECQSCFGSTHFIESARMKVHGVSFSLAGRAPLADGFELLGRAGVLWSQVTYDEVDNGTLLVPGQYPVKDDKPVPALGLSLGWYPGTHWEVLLGLDGYSGLGKSSLTSFDVSVLSLGLQYHF